MTSKEYEQRSNEATGEDEQDLVWEELEEKAKVNPEAKMFYEALEPYHTYAQKQRKGSLTS